MHPTIITNAHLSASIAELAARLDALARALAPIMSALSVTSVDTAARVRQVVLLVSTAHRISMQEMLSKSRIADTVVARHTTIWICLELGLGSRAAVARALGLDVSTLGHALRVVADRRATEPAYRARLDSLLRQAAELTPPAGS